MHFVPHEYQQRAIRWIMEHPRCLLFMEMGLGKSVVTLTAVRQLMDYAEVSRVLVVAPKKVAESTWGAESEKWDHLQLRVSVILGTQAECRAAMEREADIYVTSRDRIVWLIREYKGVLPYDMIVLDELTSFKNHSSQRFKALKAAYRAMTARHRLPRIVGLTGTPTPNGMLDLWAQVFCVDQGERLGTSFIAYRKKYFDTYERNNIVYRAWLKKGVQAEIEEKIADITLTMRAEDWLTMPPLIEKDVAVTLPEAKLRAYNRFQRDCVLEMKGEEITAQSAAALVNKLSQFANGAIYNEQKEAVEIHTEKIEMLAEIVESSTSPILCFYAYKHDASRIMAALRDAKPRMYEGNAELEDWNAGKIRLLLAHPAATAFGLNMQKGGHTVVWFSTGWNLELYQQANARLHRQGQEHPVMVYRLIAGGTIDERISTAIGSKKEVQTNFVKRMATAIISDEEKKKDAED